MSAFLDNLGALAPLIVFLFAAAESAAFVGFVIPGELAVVLGGVAAGTGTVSLWMMLPAAVIGAVVGDSVGYRIGRGAGPRLVARPRMARLARRLETASRIVAERGWYALVVARFTAVLRAVVPFAAGLGSMPYRRFLLGNVIGGVAWGTTFTLVGYFAGANYPVVERWLRTGGLAVVGVVVVVAGIAWTTRWIQGNQDVVIAWLRRMVGRRPWRWLAAGISRSRHPATTLILAASGIVAGLWLFGGLVQDVVRSEEFFFFDQSAISYLEAHRIPALVQAARLMHGVTGWGWILVTGAAAGVVTLARRRHRIVAAGVLALAGQWGIIELTAALVDRAPPSFAPIVARVDYGFPSEHVAMVTALVLVAAWPWSRPGWRPTVARFGLATVVLTLTGLSRVILLVEYPSDALAGAAVAASWALITCLIMDRHPPGRAGIESSDRSFD